LGLIGLQKAYKAKKTAFLKSKNSRHFGTSLLFNQITAGLNDQQRGPVNPAHMHQQVPQTLDDIILNEIFNICLNKKTAKSLFYNMIHLFPKSLQDFLSVCYKRTRGQKVQDVIYTSAFSKLMHDHFETL